MSLCCRQGAQAPGSVSFVEEGHGIAVTFHLLKEPYSLGLSHCWLGTDRIQWRPCLEAGQKSYFRRVPWWGQHKRRVVETPCDNLAQQQAEGKQLGLQEDGTQTNDCTESGWEVLRETFDFSQKETTGVWAQGHSLIGLWMWEAGLHGSAIHSEWRYYWGKPARRHHGQKPSVLPAKRAVSSIRRWERIIPLVCHIGKCSSGALITTGCYQQEPRGRE